MNFVRRPRLIKLLLLGIIILWCANAMAQGLSNLRTKYFYFGDTIVLDSLSVIPGSFILYNDANAIVGCANYNVLFDQSLLVFNKPYSTNRLFRAEYRVFPLRFAITIGGESIFAATPLDSNSSKPSGFYKQGIVIADPTLNQRINANGNISRGLSAGNGQNMVLNSNLNLQLNGKIDDDISIDAVLSDENIPVQPNGYTQQVNAFDQIYIRLYDSLRYLQMGDVDISSNQSHFLRYQKRLQGADFAGNYSINNKTKYYTKASAAVAKGTFNRIEFSGIEGVQGPYNLSGANNEQFIVVLAGSERVFIDGIRLIRGENADYVINYNTAEVTFTSSRMITKDSRIIVEFEYSDKNYNRFLISGKSAIETNKSKISFEFYSEGDAKNQPVNQNLTDEQKLILAKAGDDPLKAIVPNFDSVAFDKNRVLYAMMDSIIEGRVYDSIFKVSFNPSKGYYQVGFALVGENNGNYMLVPSAANGKVYEWVAPVQGTPQGNYEPIQILVAPKTQQMYLVALQQQLGKNTTTNVELALSNKNQNAFSSIDNHNNQGVAFSNGTIHYFNLASNRLKTYGNYEFVHKDFKAIERFRNAEFNRDWNISQILTGQQQLVTIGTALEKKDRKMLDLSADYLNVQESTEGLKLNLQSDLKDSKNTFNSFQSMLLSSDSIKHSKFYRHKLKYARSFSWFKSGVVQELESNAMTSTINDSLMLESMQFNDVTVYIQMHDSLKRNVGLSYRNRIDFSPYQNSFMAAYTASDFAAQATLSKMKNNNLLLAATYRKLKVLNEEIVGVNKNDESLLGRMDHQLRIAKNSVSFNTFYELGTGLEQKQDFVYIEVAMGQGVYVWVDYNGNGIPELDEFEIAKFIEEANYLRVYTPSNDYIKAYTLKVNHTFSINPNRIWRKSKGVKKFLARFSNVTSIRLMQKHTNNNVVARINPFNKLIADTSLLYNRSYFRNTFSFNRSNPVFASDWIFTYNNFKTLLVNGFDHSQNRSNQFQFRWNISPSVFLKNSITVLYKTYYSEYFSNKNYNITALSNNANIQWQPSPKFRLALNYKYSDKDNLLGIERAFVHEIGPQIKINRPGKGSISSGVSIVQARYNVDDNSPLSYEMLNGFNSGQNYRWNLRASYNINQYLRLSLLYNGRKASDIETIHTGQASISAFF